MNDEMVDIIPDVAKLEAKKSVFTIQQAFTGTDEVIKLALRCMTIDEIRQQVFGLPPLGGVDGNSIVSLAKLGN